MAAGVGGSSDGETVGEETGVTGLPEVTGDGFTVVGGDGVHAAAVSTTKPASNQNQRRGTSDTTHDLTWGLSERNALD